MNKKLLLSAVCLLSIFILASCSEKHNFEYGLKRINKLNSKYNSTMDTYPFTIDVLKKLAAELGDLRYLKLEAGQEAFDNILDYRLHNTAANMLYIESQKYGLVGTTKEGFGCKSRPIIIESSGLRNESAKEGFKAVDNLNILLDKFPEESAKANLTRKGSLFLNVTYVVLFNDANKDRRIIDHFCPENVTLELLKQELLKNKESGENSN